LQEAVIVTDSSAVNDNLVRQLRERIKELGCIYAISHIAADPTAPFDQIIRDITDGIPSAFQAPGSTCACVTIGDKATKTANFKSCSWRLEADIAANEEIAGKLEVGYLGTVPPQGSPFVEEERELVQVIAGRIGIVLRSKNLKDSLGESEKRYRTLVENSLTGIFQTTLDGRFVYVNDIFLKMLEYDSFVELAGINAASLYRDGGKRTALINRIRGQNKISNYELELVTRSGRPITFIVTLSLEDTIMTGTAMDVTERKRIEEELKAKSLSLEETNIALKVLLQQGQKALEEMRDTFLSNVKHLILPYVEKLHETPLHYNQKALLTIIEANLRDIVSPFLRNLSSVHSGLTSTEIRIALLIREGSAVKEIAQILGTSASSVNLHRQNIRNKLGLNKKKVNLHTYLASLSQ
jgi:PAS domain S-box-containing protein